MKRACPVSIPVIASLALVSSIGCAGSLSSGEGMLAVRSKHATIYSNVSEQNYLATMTSFEYARASLASSFFPAVDLGEVDLLVVEEADYGAIFGYQDRLGAVMPKAPGGGKIGENGLIVMTPDAGGGRMNELLTHLFIHKKSPGAPLWFHEGFSAWASSLQYKEGDGGQRVACFNRAGGGKEPTVKLSELVAMPWDKYNGESKKWYRYTARTLIDFIINGEEGKHREKMGPFVGSLFEGKDTTAVLAETFPGTDLDALTGKVTEHGNAVQHQDVRGLCPLGFPIPPEKAPDTGERKVEPAPAAEIQKLVGGLKKLPGLDGYAPWFPPEVVARAGG
jgi:hypothetical protein